MTMLPKGALFPTLLHSSKLQCFNSLGCRAVGEKTPPSLGTAILAGSLQLDSFLCDTKIHYHKTRRSGQCARGHLDIACFLTCCSDLLEKVSEVHFYSSSFHLPSFPLGQMSLGIIPVCKDWLIPSASGQSIISTPQTVLLLSCN